MDRSHNLARGTQTASIWLDESGSRSTARDCFVVAGIKTRHADRLLRQIQVVRDEYQFHNRELKWGRVDERTSRIYYDIIEVLAASDARVVAAVVDGATFNPFDHLTEPWRAHAHVNARIVQGNINRNEVVTVLLDGITTPPGIAMGQVVKRMVNSRLKTTSVVDAYSLNSKTNDLLQVADMVAGAIFYTRLRAEGRSEVKNKVAQRLAWAFEQPSLDKDARTGRLNISTLECPRDPKWIANESGRPGRSRNAR